MSHNSLNCVSNTASHVPEGLISRHVYSSEVSNCELNRDLIDATCAIGGSMTCHRILRVTSAVVDLYHLKRLSVDVLTVRSRVLSQRYALIRANTPKPKCRNLSYFCTLSFCIQGFASG